MLTGQTVGILGGYAEYCLVKDWTTFHIGKHITFEEAATVPMGALMASIGLWGMLKVRMPWDFTSSEPLLVYGGATSVGANAIQLGRASGMAPIITVAGRGSHLVERLIDRNKGDVIVDYRDGDQALVNGIRQALNGNKLKYALDCVSEHESDKKIYQVLDKDGGKISIVLPRVQDETPPGIELTNTMAGSLWKVLEGSERLGQLGLGPNGADFGYCFSRLIGRMLDDGRLKAHPYEVIAQGLSGVEEGLTRLRSNQASGIKFVYRVAETPGLKAGRKEFSRATKE